MNNFTSTGCSTIIQTSIHGLIIINGLISGSLEMTPWTVCIVSEMVTRKWLQSHFYYYSKQQLHLNHNDF